MRTTEPSHPSQSQPDKGNPPLADAALELLRQSPQPLALIQLEGQPARLGSILCASPGLQRLSGHSQAALQSMAAEDLLERAGELAAYLGQGGVVEDLATVLWARQGPPRPVTASAHVAGGTALLRLEEARDDRELKRPDAIAEGFLADLTHEMRTPLSAITGLTEMALADKTDMDPELRHALVSIRSASDGLLNLVGNVLDMSSMEAGKLEIVRKPFTTRDMAHNALEPVAALARAKGLDFSWSVAGDVPEVLLGDAGRLGQILTNLAANAVKFTPEGSVEAALCWSQGVGLTIAVRDTGIGIPKEQQEKLFTDFTRLQGPEGLSAPGTGLGLAISQRLAQLMGGGIHVDSSPGRGSTFTVTVPLTEARLDAPPVLMEGTGPPTLGRVAVTPGMPDGPAPAHSFASPLQPSHRELPPSLHILLAEDNKVNQSYLQYLLDGMGAKVRLAVNGQEALDLLAQDPCVDVILMDIQMPVMNGVECLQAIRRGEVQGLDTSVPVVALTAYATSSARDEFLRLGMDGYLSKPLRRPDLVAVLADVLSGGSSQQSTSAAAQPAFPPHHAADGGPNLDAAFVELFENDDGSMRTVLKLFLDQTGVLEEELRGALTAGDGESVAARCHKLASAAGMLHHPDLHSRALATEATARTGNLDATAREVDGLLREVAVAEEAVREYLKS